MVGRRRGGGRKRWKEANEGRKDERKEGKVRKKKKRKEGGRKESHEDSFNTFNNYLLNAFSVPGAMLGVGD